MTWTLYFKGTDKKPVAGETYPDFRGDPVKLEPSLGEPPRHAGSTGRIYTDQGAFYPSVCNMEWRQDDVTA